MDYVLLNRAAMHYSETYLQYIHCDPENNTVANILFSTLTTQLKAHLLINHNNPNTRE